MTVMAPTMRTRPTTPPPFAITERDIHTIMGFLARVRFATLDQIIRFAAGSEKNLSNRVRLLHWHTYINRIDDREALVKLFNILGNTAPVYGLARAGVQLLASRGIHPAKIRAKAPLIAHSISMTEFALQCALASRQDGAPQFLHHSDLLPAMPEATRALEHPFRFRVPFQQDFKTISLNVDPDIMLSFLFADNHRHNFCVEIDLGTETIATRRHGKIVFAKSTFARKQAAYLFGHKEGRHREQWDWQSFRVLTVTPSEKRIHALLASQAEVSGNRMSGLYLYTTPMRIKEHGIFAPIWISADRDDVSINERS